MSDMVFGIMALPRTFVGFSSSDISYYHLMCAWKAHDHIDFDFADFQIDEAINSTNEYYIKQVCRNKIAGPISTPCLSAAIPTSKQRSSSGKSKSLSKKVVTSSASTSIMPAPRITVALTSSLTRERCLCPSHPGSSQRH